MSYQQHCTPLNVEEEKSEVEVLPVNLRVEDEYISLKKKDDICRLRSYLKALCYHQDVRKIIDHLIIASQQAGL